MFFVGVQAGRRSKVSGSSGPGEDSMGSSACCRAAERLAATVVYLLSGIRTGRISLSFNFCCTLLVNHDVLETGGHSGLG